MIRVGVISDTHGLLRPQAKAALAGCDYLVHGGDIGNAGILEELAAMAPLTVVRGNNDRAGWAGAVPDTARLAVGPVIIHAIHDIATLALDPAAEGIAVVVYGHSHKARVDTRNGVLFLNPGSAGPRRFSLPVSVAELLIDGASVSARIIDLDIS
ncbi:metallophosphatase family protein [Massilia sp. PAMC28688]|uniref:metallophosphoesterase family protein n=1 Tax=Massilia sp. PAMC28688 TaxID=2861283 RepID=UPI001C626E25|nr:metallophosphoesterase family protein [Massilia sp. PAMC28688]QYF92435.1 metallophosphatase family protein [Massilia sp. PAMC28688]